MTLPPERITIKRRREDEPVEALYIEQKRHCSSSTCWVRVRDEKSFDISAVLSQRAHPGSVGNSDNHAKPSGPKTQKLSSTKDATLEPSLSSPSMQIIQNIQEADEIEKFSTQSLLPDQGKTIHGKKSSYSRPRIFHFSNKSKALAAPSMVSLHGIKKSRGVRRDLAVFEEKIKTARDPRDLNAEFRKDTTLSGQSVDTPRVKERIHVNSNSQPTVSGGGNSSMPECLPEAVDGGQAISKLRKADEATECSSQDVLNGTQRNKIGDAPLQPQIKLQPKFATALREENRTFGTALEGLPDAQDSESQDDFVYDTYLRTKPAMVSFQSDGAMDIHQIENVANGKVGILVIAERDEAAWEAYGEEEESDKDWNSEEEDENAEDFYGNDYPEDEIDSDDEYGRDAYQYRNYNSDDEEFDRDWSDEEDEVSMYGRTRDGMTNFSLYE